MKKLLAILLALSLLLSVAIPAFAFPSTEDGVGEDDNYGITAGYVRTKKVRKSADGYTSSTVSTYNKQGKPVKTVETTKSEDYLNKTTTKFTYNKKGNLTKKVTYYNDYITTSTYTYNKAGKLTREIHWSVYEDNSSFTTTQYHTYNKAGEESKTVIYYDDCEETIVYTYNKAGQVTKETITRSYEDNTKTKIVTAYTYDKNGNETKMSMVDKDRYGGTEKRVYVCAYNEKNLCVKKTESWSYTDRAGNIDTSRDVTTYTYDKNGNLTKEVFKSNSTGGGKRTVTFLYTYDKDGNCTQWVTSEKSSFYTGTTTKTYVYKAGRLVKETTVTLEGGSVTESAESYAYDKAGNLTKYSCVYQDPDGMTCKDVVSYAYQKIDA